MDSRFLAFCFRRLNCNFYRHYTAPAIKEKAKIFHPFTETPYPEYQTYSWTKTQRTSELPSEFLQFKNAVDVTQISKLAEKAVVFARHFQYQDKAKPQEYASGQMQNLMKVIFMQAPHHPHLANLHVAFEPQVRTIWRYKRHNLAVFGRPGTLFTSRQSLPRLFDNSAYKNVIEHPVPPPERSMTLFSGLMDRPVYKNKISGGFFPCGSFPFAHTLLVVDHVDLPIVRRYKRSCTESRKLAERAEIVEMHRQHVLRNCVIHMYSLLLAQAVEKHGHDVLGTELPEPECMQAIITNGQRFTFLWYQLNTLAITNSIKPPPRNLVMISEPEMLFSRVAKKAGEANVRAIDFNEKVLQTIMAMVLWN